MLSMRYWGTEYADQKDQLEKQHARDGTDVWGTVGVSENVIEASWLALVDSIEYALIRR